VGGVEGASGIVEGDIPSEGSIVVRKNMPTRGLIGAHHGSLSKAHRIAIENPKVRADMVDAGTFPQLAVKYNVSSVPKTVINERIEIIGAEPIEKLIEEAAKA